MIRKTPLALALCLPLALFGCGSDEAPTVKINPDDPSPIQPEPEPEEVLFTTGTYDIEPTIGTEIPSGLYRLNKTGQKTPDEECSAPEHPDEPEINCEDMDLGNTGIALVSSTGRLVLALEDRTAFARIQLDERNRFNSRLQDTEAAELGAPRTITGGRDRLSRPDEVRISGAVTDKETLSLIETITLDKQLNNHGELDMVELAGTYRQANPEGPSAEYTITNGGVLTGTDTTGCEFTGTVATPNVGERIFEAQFEAKGCGPTETTLGQQRDGEYRALGRLIKTTHTLSLFAENDVVATRFSGVDVDAPVEPEPPVDPGPPKFVSDTKATDPMVMATLNPGAFGYLNIPVEEFEDPDDEPKLEMGGLLISPTGRIAGATDRRVFVTKVNVTDVDTFRSELAQEDTSSLPDAEDDTPSPSDATEIFGTPNESLSGEFEVIGSLLDDSGALANRYLAVRNDAVSGSGVADEGLIELTGTYRETQDVGLIHTTITIAEDGTLTGSDNTGCVFNGEAFIPEPGINIFEFKYSAQNCTATRFKTGDERNGDYNSVGHAEIGGMSSAAIEVITASQNNIRRFVLIRQ